MPVIYRLDDRDRFVAINQKWSGFAEANGAPELAGDRVIGDSLWRYISGVDVAQIYREVFRKVRSQRVQVVFPFRCDSPEARRDMLMKVLPKENSQVEIQCITRSIVKHQLLETVPPTRQTATAAGLVRICSWCKSVKLGDQWIALEAAIKQLDLFGGSPVPQLTHGVCPRCNDDLISALR